MGEVDGKKIVSVSKGIVEEEEKKIKEENEKLKDQEQNVESSVYIGIEEIEKGKKAGKRGKL